MPTESSDDGTLPDTDEVTGTIVGAGIEDFELAAPTSSGERDEATDVADRLESTYSLEHQSQETQSQPPPKGIPVRFRLDRSPPMVPGAAGDSIGASAGGAELVTVRKQQSGEFGRRMEEQKLQSAVTGRLIIRKYVPEDRDAVKRICFAHFRSLTFAAVRFYVTEHFVDCLVLLILAALFIRNFSRVFLAALLFQVYIFLRSRLDMENYIRRDCADLRDIKAAYFSTSQGNDLLTTGNMPNGNTPGSSCFWVAEIAPDATAGNSGIGGSSSIVGCIGLTRSREDRDCGKVVRLVVDRSFRRLRIGSRLLSTVEEYAAPLYDSLRMYTNTLNPSHMKFVRQHGFTVTETVRRGSTRGDLIIWLKTLRNAPLSSGSLSRPSRPSLQSLTQAPRAASNVAGGASSPQQVPVVKYGFHTAAQGVMD